MATYKAVKAAVIDVVDDFTEKDVTANYRPKGAATFKAGTKLSTLRINEVILAGMPIRFNKVLEALCSPNWTDVGAIDLVDMSTIGDLIELACGNSGTPMPAVEPT